MAESAREAGSEHAARRTGRGFGAVLVAGLATAGLGTLAAGRTWATASTGTPGPREVTVAGTDVAPVMLPLGLVALACWGAFLVLRTSGRRVVAVLGALAAGGGVVAAVTSASGATDAAADLLSRPADAGTSTAAWPWVGAVALAVCLAAFVVAFLRCPTWPQMSRRYDRDDASPATGGALTATEATPADQWRAMDDGRDPTV